MNQIETLRQSYERHIAKCRAEINKAEAMKVLARKRRKSDEFDYIHDHKINGQLAAIEVLEKERDEEVAKLVIQQQREERIQAAMPDTKRDHLPPGVQEAYTECWRIHTIAALAGKTEHMTPDEWLDGKDSRQNTLVRLKEYLLAMQGFQANGEFDLP